MRFGIVGCGTIAQIMHLPYLVELPGVTVHALADPAEDRRDVLGDRYGVDERYADAASLVEGVGDELDAAVVSTPAHAHAEAVTTLLDAGVHTLVEKPLAATLDDADRMVAAARESEAVSMVGYMKRYDPAYERAADLLDDFSEVDLVTAYDVDPDHGRIIDEVYDIVGASLPPGFVEESVATRREQLCRAVDTDDEFVVDAYDFQLDHVCHDVNALRGLFGRVERIRDVDVFADGRYATATLEYEDGVRCVLETGDSDRKWFEQFVRVDAPDAALTLDFSNPYIRNSPTELRVERGVETREETSHTPSYDESFRRELARFVRCIEEGAPVRTPFAEAREDLRVIVNLFRVYQGKPVLPPAD